MADTVVEALFDVVVEHDVMIVLRDGVRLATDLYRPARNGKAAPGRFPVILERTPYDKTAPSRAEKSAGDAAPKSRLEVASFFVRHGYVVVYQDCRGRYGSEGEFVKYLGEANDGADTIEWLSRQSWCDGQVAMMGLSYAAHTQAAAACLDPKGLAAMVLDSGGFANAFRGGIRQGGAFELKQATWAYAQARLSTLAKTDPKVMKALDAQDITAWFGRMPWRKGHSPLSAVPEYEDYLLEQWQHGTFDDFWKQIGIYAEGFYEHFSDVPCILMSSWYDPYPLTATTNYLGLKAQGKGPLRLILGPWTHGNRVTRYAGDADFGPAAVLDGSIDKDFLTLRRRWFDHWLKGIDNGVDSEPEVRYFRMGGGTGRKLASGRFDHGGAWKSAASWPIPGTRYRSFYLHSGGSLSEEPSPANAEPLTFRFDPDDPVPSIGGTITSGAPVMEGGAYDQREDPRFYGCKAPFLPLSARPDVLVFETAPLKQDLEITGPITARLWISSDCPDTDFTVKLIDCYPPSADYPDGLAVNVTDGILRLRYRDSWEHPSLMTPGNVYQITVEPFPTSNLFKAGHRIRLDVSSSNFPHFDVNPNTGEPEGRGRGKRVATNTVFMDAVRTSCVVLPVVPE